MLIWKKIIEYNRVALKSNEPFLLTRYIGRPLALPLTWIFDRLGWSPNQVTFLNGVFWLVGLLLICIAPLKNDWFLLAGGFFLFWGSVLDIVDGGIARLHKKGSLNGAYFDLVLHLICNPILPACVGYFLTRFYDMPAYLILGIFATAGGWGFSQAARSNIVLQDPHRTIQLANGSEKTYQTLLLDNNIAQASAYTLDWKNILKKLPYEFFFPGNVYIFPASITIDFIVARISSYNGHLLLLSTFIVYTSALFISIPFRVRREFLLLKHFEEESNSKR